MQNTRNEHEVFVDNIYEGIVYWLGRGDDSARRPNAKKIFALGINRSAHTFVQSLLLFNEGAL